MKRGLMPALMFGLILSAGCASQRTAQFRDFAAAGMEYSEAMLALTQEAGRLAIDVDSEALMLSQEASAGEILDTLITEHTAAVKEFMAELDKHRRHTLSLEAYFASLHALAASQAPDAAAAETAALVDAMGELRKELQAASFGSAAIEDDGTGAPSVGDLMAAAVPMVVGAFRHKALENELAEHADDLERELELQSAVLELLAPQMQADLQQALDLMHHRKIVIPYIRGSKLNDGWKSSRRELLAPTMALPAVDEAAGAAAQLKQLFIDLVENRVRPEDYGRLFADIKAMLDLIKLAQETGRQE